MRILTFPIVQYFLKYLGLAPTKRSYWEYEKINLGNRKMYKRIRLRKQWD